MRKYFPYILFIFLFFIYFLCYQSVLSHVIYYQEQHHLFLYSKTFFLQHIQSQGWMSYLTAFIIQFFHIPTIGSILLAGILALIYLLTNDAIKKITGHNDLLLLSLIPSIYLFLYSMTVDHSLTPIIATFLGLLIMSLFHQITVRPWSFIRKIYSPLPPNNKYRLLIYSLLIAIYAGTSFYFFVQTYNMSEHRMIMAEKSVKEKNWENVLTQTEKYINSGRTNQLISYFHNLALYHTGKLPYQLFDYPQKLGVKALYFPWNSDSRESEYGHFIYEDLGYINEAQRWEFEAMVVWGETAPHLLNLARYNIVNKRPEVARRFINLLKQSLFYRKDAEELEKQLYAGSVPGLRMALENNKEHPARFANVINIGPELQYLCEQDTTNRMAFEYLMSDLLLSNNVVRFVDNLKFIRHFKYPEMPPAYQEALYIYKLGVDGETFSKSGFNVSENTEKRFQRYYSLYKNRQMQRLKTEFGNTYWYYLNFISPYGDKIIKN